MNQIVLTDELLRRAVIRSHDRWIRKYCPSEESEEYEFPKGFFESLIHYANKRKHFKTISRGVAAAVLALLAAGTILLAASPAARAAVFSWVKEVFGGHIIYHFQEDSPLTEIPQYTLSYIPEGFVEMESIHGSTKQSLFYLNNETNEVFLFECRLLLERNYTEYLTGETGTHEMVTVNGSKAEFYSADEVSSANNLIWFDESKRIVFSIDSNLDQSVMLHIAEGVILSDPT